ncbi:hypothetical protein PHPALM_30446 [Phytophthora palmivora]|uniref:Uncharacterized protein n=1 Tax=Phytophthora palmivora TaxID=4796 RepID=A0A2P4X541_9STRA|nr:hypothetical protein PHPALM_30446 [Phytophthora palmivora]
MPTIRNATTTETSARRIGTGSATTMAASIVTSVIPVTATSIMPSYITDISHPALMKRGRQKYEDAIEAHCATTGEDKAKAIRSVKNSFNRNLLNTLGKLEWGMTIEEELKMDLREPDVKASVINNFMLCDDIKLQRGLRAFFRSLLI